jgi:5,10-methylenetetrahydromethanopterin reductase
MGLIPCSPLLVTDPYVNLASAAKATESLQLGTLLDTPVLRHAAVLASSIATVAKLAPGRTHMGLGIGDTAVRLNGLAPATVESLKTATSTIRSLLNGDSLEVGAARPARLRHASPVPVWIAAQGPKTLRMAGEVADGVWIRVGTHPANLAWAWEAVCEGAAGAGRSPSDIQLGLIFHTALADNRRDARLIAKAIAAGYYEYSPFLFDAPGLAWQGPDIDELRAQVWPDFHHHRDPLHAGRVVEFLDDSIADSFALHGTWDDISEQLQAVLDLGLPASYVVPHPVLPPASPHDFLQEFSAIIPDFNDYPTANP